MITKKIILRVLAILLLANAFLPIVMKNLPFPFYSTLFWMAAWIGALVFLNFKTFLDLKFLIIIFNLIVFYLLSASTHINAYLASRYIRDCVDIFIAASVFAYFYKSKDIKGLSILLNTFLVFIVISAITSIIGFYMYPNSIRYNAYRSMINLRPFYNRLGIQGYDFFYGLAFASPVIFYNFKKLFSKRKIIGILFFAVFIFSFVKADYATAFLFMMVGLFFALVGRANFKKNKKLIITIAIIMIILPNVFYTTILEGINNLIDPNSTLSNRLGDLSLTIEGEVETHGVRRLERIPFLIEEISNNFFFGGGESTGHVYWLDIFSLYGLFVLISFASIFFVFIKYILNIIPDSYKYYYLISVLFFIANGFVKNSGGDIVFYSVFLIMPGFGIIEKYKINNNYIGDKYVHK